MRSAWVMWRGAGRNAAESALRYVAPVGEKDAWVQKALAVVAPSITEPP